MKKVSTPILRSWTWPAKVGRDYRIEVRSSAFLVLNGHTVGLAQWFEKEPETEGLGTPHPIKSAYLKPSHDGFSGCIRAPKGAKLLRVSVMHWSQLSPAPKVKFAASIEEGSFLVKKEVVLGAAYEVHSSGTTYDQNIKTICDTILRAAKEGVQLLCLSENFPSRGVVGTTMERAVTLDSPQIKPVFEAVKKAKIHVVFGLLESYQKKPYTSAVLLSPTAEIIGVYRKRYLTFDELYRGQIPGGEFPVFQTELGKVGMLICWDTWFPETARALTRKGAEIICVPIAGDGVRGHADHVWRARAMDNRVYWITSITGNCGEMAPSRIIAPTGDLLAETKKPNAIAKAKVDINEQEECFWLAIPDCNSEHRNVLDFSYRPDEYR